MLTILPFDNDTMGSTAGSRLVAMEVKGSFSVLSLPFYVEADRIRQALLNDGWNVLDVQQTSFNVGGIGNRTFHVFAEVNNNHNDSNVVSTARRVLGSVMTVSSVYLLHNADALYKDRERSFGWEAFWRGLGLTAAPAAATVILGGGLLLAVLLRR